MALMLLSRSRKLLSDCLRFARVSPALVIKSRQTVLPNPPSLILNPFSGKPSINSSFHPPSMLFFRSYSSKKEKPIRPVPIKLVCCVDFQSVSISEYEKVLRLISYRFPLVDRLAGSGMRRTVRKNEFSADRSFFFVKCAYGEYYVDLLVCTESTRLVGVRSDGRLIVFVKHLFDNRAEIAVLAEVDEGEIFYVNLMPVEENGYLCLCQKDFKDAVKNVESFIIDHLEGSDIDYIKVCLGFLYDILVRGSVFSYTKSLVVDSLMLTSDGTPLKSKFSRKDWEDLSSSWFLEHQKKGVSTSVSKHDIEMEVFIVKASVLVAVDLQKRADIIQKQVNDNMRERKLEKLEDGEYRYLSSLGGWEAGKLGYDFEEYLEEAGISGVYVAVERAAFKKAVELYHLGLE